MVGLIGGGLAVLAPIALAVWLTADPARNRAIVVPNEHFYIVTLVSVLEAVVALFVARATLHLQQYRVLLVALGFMTMAGFFSVHAIHTPGVMFGHGYGSSNG